MNPETQFIGSIWIRIGTLALLALTATLWMVDANADVAVRTPLLWLAIVFSIATFIGCVHSFDMTYELWMKFANALHVVVVSILFGLCYLLVIPLFLPIIYVLDPLKLRRGNKDSFWNKRPKSKLDLSSLQRMG